MKLDNVLVLTFLAAASTLCGTVSIVFATTLGEGESIIDLIFWPTLGFIGFSAMLVKSWHDHTYCAMATHPSKEEK